MLAPIAVQSCGGTDRVTVTLPPCCGPSGPVAVVERVFAPLPIVTVVGALADFPLGPTTVVVDCAVPPA